MLGQVPSSAADSHSHEGRGFLGSMRDRLRDALQESEEHLLRRAREAVRAGLAAPRPSARRAPGMPMHVLARGISRGWATA